MKPKLAKKLASKMEYHTGQRYSDAVGYIGKRLRRNPQTKTKAKRDNQMFLSLV